MKKVAIIMGSDSDFPVVKKSAEVLQQFGVPFELRVLSAHRCAAQVSEFASGAEDNGFGVIIAAAGKAAHLAGAIAGQTPLPVIGIPIKASALEGIDALLSTVQMPAGVPVATVAIDGAANAGYLAVQILSVGDDDLMSKLKAFRAEQTAKVLAADKKMQEQVL
ncbi:MAG: 5-(carboxyamino)imidazole ribonucleotide mutase [Eubacterium sp.]|nr:5-(carboxyamino)imidazole ribonucleotide mutase [Eubacterium sp.]